MPLAIDHHEYLVEVPSPPARLHARQTPFADLRREQRAETLPPEPDRLLADIDAPAGAAGPRRCEATTGDARTSCLPGG